jgi:hypothetical protein
VTASSFVNLVTTPSQQGSLTVSVSAYLKDAGGNKTLIGTASAAVTVSGSPFAGTWSGPYTAEVSPPEIGTMSWTISQTGAINGSGVNTTIGFTFQIKGAIDNKGNLSGTIDMGRTMGGTLSIAANGQLVGNVESIYPDGTYYLNAVDFTKTS